MKLTVSLRNFVDRKQNSCFLALYISLRNITPIPQNMSSLIEEHQILDEVGEKVRFTMQALGEERDVFGLIHAEDSR